MNHRSWKSDSPHENLTSRGVIFQRFLHIENKFLYPRNEVLEVYLFHHSCLSVCPSVSPSVKKWFLYNNSSSIWHTMIIFHIYIELDLMRTFVYLGSKGQRSNLDFNLFLPFPHHSSIYLEYNNDTSQMYWPRPEKDLYWFWRQRIKAQATEIRSIYADDSNVSIGSLVRENTTRYIANQNKKKNENLA